MDALEQLAAFFEKFPGVGPRQSRRFVHYLLRSSPAIRKDLARQILAIANTVMQCPDCMRFHAGSQSRCDICRDTERDQSLLMVVISDADLMSVEGSHTYRGHYFVLGGMLPLSALESILPRKRDFDRVVQERLTNGLTEVILALPANPEGDLTALEVERILKEGTPLRVTTLGRGLSTGSELEYADPETIKNALSNRR